MAELGKVELDGKTATVVVARSRRTATQPPWELSVARAHDHDPGWYVVTLTIPAYRSWQVEDRKVIYSAYREHCDDFAVLLYRPDKYELSEFVVLMGRLLGKHEKDIVAATDAIDEALDLLPIYDDDLVGTEA